MRSTTHTGTRRLCAVLAAATILAQIAYPLTDEGDPLRRLTIATVVLFATTSVLHAAATRGVA